VSKLIEGHKLFKNNYFHEHEENFVRLVKDGQSPKALFIGCSDSRVIPDLTLNTKPGDLFVVRNVGNFIPPHSFIEDFHGTASAIEYAVSVLNVSEIIICGHTHCGACATLHTPEKVEGLPHLQKWLQIGEEARHLSILSGATEEDLLRQTEKISITTQIDNILTYPEVKKRVTQRKLHIHGWLYHIENGDIEYYDLESKSFRPLSDNQKIEK